jgi:hypothetical protein
LPGAWNDMRHAPSAFRNVPNSPASSWTRSMQAQANPHSPPAQGCQTKVRTCRIKA